MQGCLAPSISTGGMCFELPSFFHLFLFFCFCSSGPRPQIQRTGGDRYFETDVFVLADRLGKFNAWMSGA